MRQSFDAMKLYGEVQEQLGQGILILEVHSEDYKNGRPDVDITIRFVWFPKGEIKPGEPMADISTIVPKSLNPKYDHLANQLTPNMRAAIEAKFPGTLSKSTNDQAHPDHRAEPEKSDPKEDEPGGYWGNAR